MDRNDTPTQTPPGADLLRLDHQVCFALYSASLAMTKVYKPLLDRLGLTYPQYLVMLALWDGDAMTVSALGERLSLDSGTLTPLKRLEGAGLVLRTRDRQDERRVRSTLTDAGRALRTEATAIPACILAASGCTVPELMALNTRLRELRGHLAEAAPLPPSTPVPPASTEAPTP